VKAPVYYVERLPSPLGSTSVVGRDDVRFWGKTGCRGPNVKPTRMTHFGYSPQSGKSRSVQLRIGVTRKGCPKGQYHSDASASRIPLAIDLLVVSGVQMSRPGRHCPFASRTSQGLVEQAERMALADGRTPPNIATMCQMLAVSERSLRNAFHVVHIPPYRRLRMLMLSRARRTLMSAGAWS